MGDHDLLDEVKIRLGCAASCYAAKESKHFNSERIVAGQFPEIGDEQDHADVNARNNEEQTRDKVLRDRLFSITGVAPWPP